MNIYYVNSAGKTLNLLSDEIAIQDVDTLFTNEWSYSSATSMIFGGKVKKFYKGVQEKEFTISLVSDTEEEFTELCKEIEDVIFYDVIMKSPGRLYVNDTYLTCYIYSSEYTEYEDLFYITDRKFKLVTEYPNWVAEREYTINKSVSLLNAVVGFAVAGSAILSSGTDPEEDDDESTTAAYVNNTQDIPCNYKLKIYGPNEWPYLVVGENVYNFDYEIPEGSYLLVDSIKRTATVVDPDGSETNVFGYRNPDYYLFEKIQPGIQDVTWNGSTALEFTIYEERGEPLWS